MVDCSAAAPPGRTASAAVAGSSEVTGPSALRARLARPVVASPAGSSTGAAGDGGAAAFAAGVPELSWCADRLAASDPASLACCPAEPRASTPTSSPAPADPGAWAGAAASGVPDVPAVPGPAPPGFSGPAAVPDVPAVPGPAAVSGVPAVSGPAPPDFPAAPPGSPAALLGGSALGLAVPFVGFCGGEPPLSGVLDLGSVGFSTSATSMGRVSGEPATGVPPSPSTQAPQVAHPMAAERVRRDQENGPGRRTVTEFDVTDSCH
jgi:hypothetical protein